MSKYEEFITNLKEEVNNIEVIDRKQQIKYKYVHQEKKSFKGFFKLGLSALTFLILIIVGVVSVSSPSINNPDNNNSIGGNNGVDFIKSANMALGDLNIPLAINAPFGHLYPSLPFVVGAKANLTIKDNVAGINYEEE